MKNFLKKVKIYFERNTLTLDNYFYFSYLQINSSKVSSIWEIILS